MKMNNKAAYVVKIYNRGLADISCPPAVQIIAEIEFDSFELALKFFEKLDVLAVITHNGMEWICEDIWF